MKRPAIITVTTIFLLTCLSFGPAVMAQTPQWCDFWGEAGFRGTPVGSGDVIRAYNAAGQLCGETSGNSGWFNVRVHGVYEGSPYYPNGATEGGVITFRINGQTANVLSGLNTWKAMGSERVDIEVPYQIVVIANPGGPYTGNEGSPIQFNGSGSQDAVTYEWNFGDGNTATGVSPIHTYLDDGVYTVTLTCRNGELSDTETTTATVANVPPQNVSAGGNKTGNEGQVISFSGSATDPGVLDVLTYSWNFGDGNTKTGKNVTHVYADNGVYTVTLSVSDGDGGTGTDQITATISNVPPTANAGGPYTGVVGVAVQLNGSATDPGTADIPTLVYAWDLNNNGQYTDATGPNPQATFNSEGIFPISLKVTDKDGGTSTSNTTVTITSSVQITITTNPSNLQIKVDGQTHNAPQTFLWAPGSQHVIEAVTPLYVTASLRYVWNRWDHGGDYRHTYTVPANHTTLTAHYNPQYKLSVISDYGDPQGEGWYDPGSQATFGVTSPVSGGNGIRHVFTGWTGTGNGSYTGPDLSRTIQINNGVTETAGWRTEYFLSTLVSPQDAGEVTPAPPGAWYQAGALAALGATPYEGSQWSGWSGDLTGTATPATLTMDGPKTVVANFISPIRITIRTNPEGLVFEVDGVSYSETRGFEWAQDETHQLVAPQIQSGETGIRYVFSDWSDGGAREHEYTVPGQSTTVTANYTTQYHLTVVSERGNPQGEGWYDKASLAEFGVDSTASGAPGERYRFSGWTGSGAGSYTGTSRVPSIVMNGPVTETASWRRQCFVSLAVEPEGSGTLQPIDAPGGWADAGETLRLTAVGNAAAGYGFFEWTGSFTGTTNPLSILVQNPLSLTAHFERGLIQINTEPPGLYLVVDGEEIITPKIYNWASGTTHRIGVVSPQGDSSSAVYVFRSWNDGGAAEHDITIAQGEETYTAYFDPVYRVSVESDYGTPRIDGVAVSQGLFPGGSRVSIDIDSVAPFHETIRQRFDGWNGSGAGSQTTALREIEVIVDGPITQTARWLPQFKVTVHKKPAYAPGASFAFDPAGPWFDRDQTVTLSAVITDTAYTFLGWSGAVTDTHAVIRFPVHAPMDITGSFWTPNQPPVIGRIPLIDMLEDAVWRRPFDWFLEFIHDENDPLDMLEFGFVAGPHVQVVIDTVDRRVSIIPEPDWNGVTTIEIWVMDPFGESDRATLQVLVRSVPDLPRPFSLLSPHSGFQMDSWETPMTFVWEKSLSVDEGVDIQYTFYLSPHGTLMGLGTFRIPSLQDTSITIFPQVSGNYWWGVRAEDTRGNQVWCDDIFRIDIGTSAVEGTVRIPETFALRQNHPNPFNPTTVIPYELPRASQVHLSVFDLSGRNVRTLVEASREAGYHQAVWDGKNEKGMAAASGVYLILLRTPEFRAHHKMILIR